MGIHHARVLTHRTHRAADVPELNAAAEEAAKVDHWPLTSLVEKLLTEYCRRKGFLLDDD
jgi:hypothetical protein